jgi:hypothetical protein
MVLEKARTYPVLKKNWQYLIWVRSYRVDREIHKYERDINKFWHSHDEIEALRTRLKMSGQ